MLRLIDTCRYYAFQSEGQKKEPSGPVYESLHRDPHRELRKGNAIPENNFRAIVEFSC